MVTARRDAVNKFLRVSGSKDRKVVEEALEGVKIISENEGLFDNEFEDLVELVASKKTASYIAVKLFQCLVPVKSVSNKALKDLLSWFFCQVGTGTISKTAEKQFIHWITGIVHFELGDISIIDSYFQSFLFLMRFNHLESVVSKLLCLLLKPEDAKRWTVKKILEVQKKSGPKAHTNSILSILKSFRPDVVPENVPLTRMNYDKSPYHNYFRSAHERRIHSSEYVPPSTIDITWSQSRNYDKKSAQLPRLIPTPESIDFEPAMKYKAKKFSVRDAGSMSSLGTHCLRIEIPAQTLSLLTNLAGFHVLAFSDLITKTRFSHKLRYTLFRVFILELEPYSSTEKTAFLDSIIGLQEYMQEGIPVVTDFLLHYLLIWDGEEFRDQVLNMIQWIVVKSETDWPEWLFRPIRQIFRSGGLHCKYLIIESMTSLLRNLIASIGKKENNFFDDSPASTSGHTVKAIKDLTTFVGELIVEGIVWNTDAGKRDVVTSALNYYDMCSLLEYSDDFPVVLVMPPALVYACLYSGSRVCLARMCSLLLKFWNNFCDKCVNMRSSEEFAIEIEQTRVYILDYYRCLWSDTDYQQSVESFMFRRKAFDELSWKFQNSFGINIKSILALENNATFVSDADSYPQDLMRHLSSEYPSIVDLKLFCEERKRIGPSPNGGHLSTSKTADRLFLQFNGAQQQSVM